jgi:methyl acetate hydrolase
MTVLPNIDKILRGATEAGDLPGVVALAATREGPAYQGAAGKRALPAGPDMTVDSVFWIASMTKAVTSTAAMQLVERGKLQLDQPINGYCRSSPRGGCSKASMQSENRSSDWQRGRSRCDIF